MHSEQRVTCWYCEQFDYAYMEDTVWGKPFFCKRNNETRRMNDAICDGFALRKGLHTGKWYPGKEET